MVLPGGALSLEQLGAGGREGAVKLRGALSAPALVARAPPLGPRSGVPAGRSGAELARPQSERKCLYLKPVTGGQLFWEKKKNLIKAVCVWLMLTIVEMDKIK